MYRLYLAQQTKIWLIFPLLVTSPEPKWSSNWCLLKCSTNRNQWNQWSTDTNTTLQRFDYDLILQKTHILTKSCVFSMVLWTVMVLGFLKWFSERETLVYAVHRTFRHFPNGQTKNILRIYELFWPLPFSSGHLSSTRIFYLIKVGTKRNRWYQ